MQRTVVIGIVAKHDKNSKAERTDSLIRDEVKQAIFDNHAIAIGILSPSDKILYARDNWKKYLDDIEKDKIVKQIELCDGIILQGGNCNEAYENWIANYCYQNNIPILGICAGQNSIVRGIGGKTVKLTDSEKKKHYQPHKKYVHKIKIQKDSQFYQYIQRDELTVNSRHKRIVSDYRKLRRAASCEDGYADVIESKVKSYYIGVRFHPESLYKTDETMNKIFTSFIDVCRKRQSM